MGGKNYGVCLKEKNSNFWLMDKKRINASFWRMNGV